MYREDCLFNHNRRVWQWCTWLSSLRTDWHCWQPSPTRCDWLTLRVRSFCTHKAKKESHLKAGRYSISSAGWCFDAEMSVYCAVFNAWVLLYLFVVVLLVRLNEVRLCNGFIWMQLCIQRLQCALVSAWCCARRSVLLLFDGPLLPREELCISVLKWWRNAVVSQRCDRFTP